jgi:hypothetical protein
MGYFLERGMTGDFSFHQTKPGIEISAEPRMAHFSITDATTIYNP